MPRIRILAFLIITSVASTCVAETTAKFSDHNVLCDQIIALIALKDPHAKVAELRQALIQLSRTELEGKLENLSSEQKATALDPKTRQKLPVVREGEYFSFLGGALKFDVKMAAEMISANKIAYRVEAINVKQYAEYAYAFARKNPDPGKFYLSIGVDIDFAKRIDPAALDIPGIAIEYSAGRVVLIDGNHRCARLYMDGKDSFPVYMVTLEEAQKFRE